MPRSHPLPTVLPDARRYATRRSCISESLPRRGLGIPRPAQDGISGLPCAYDIQWTLQFFSLPLTCENPAVVARQSISASHIYEVPNFRKAQERTTTHVALVA